MYVHEFERGLRKSPCTYILTTVSKLNAGVSFFVCPVVYYSDLVIVSESSLIPQGDHKLFLGGNLYRHPVFFGHSVEVHCTLHTTSALQQILLSLSLSLPSRSPSLSLSLPSLSPLSRSLCALAVQFDTLACIAGFRSKSGERGREREREKGERDGLNPSSSKRGATNRARKNSFQDLNVMSSWLHLCQF